MQVLVLVVVEDVRGEGDEAGRPVPGDRLVGADQHSQLLSSKTRLQWGNREYHTKPIKRFEWDQELLT